VIFGGIKPKQLFELLVLSRPGAVPKARLAEELWPSDQPRNVLATLETYVSVLRRRLGGDDEALGRSLIVTEYEAYRLAADQVEVDLDEFDDLIRLASGRPDDEALQLVEKALALAEGELFADEPYSRWLHEERDRSLRRVLDARVDAAALALRSSEFRLGRKHADAARILGRLDERAVRLAMIAEYALGCERQTLAIFEECRHDLVHDLGVDPTRATIDLHASIVRQDPLAALLPRRLPVQTRSSREADVARHIDVDPMAFQTLLGACTLAKSAGGTPGLLRLLDEADRLRRAMDNDEVALSEIWTTANRVGSERALAALQRGPQHELDAMPMGK
jgi:SARP family transcriptional regulator, regulator of embCAB operon